MFNFTSLQFFPMLTRIEINENRHSFLQITTISADVNQPNKSSEVVVLYFGVPTSKSPFVLIRRWHTATIFCCECLELWQMAATSSEGLNNTSNIFWQRLQWLYESAALWQWKRLKNAWESWCICCTLSLLRASSKYWPHSVGERKPLSYQIDDNNTPNERT
jgi:hypothetical protein